MLPFFEQIDAVFTDLWLENFLIGKLNHQNLIVNLFSVLEETADQKDDVIMHYCTERVDAPQWSVLWFYSGPSAGEEIKYPYIFMHFFVEWLAPNK